MYYEIIYLLNQPCPGSLDRITWICIGHTQSSKTKNQFPLLLLNRLSEQKKSDAKQFEYLREASNERW